MSTYIIGDIHGCYDELKLLLNKVKFNYSKDKLWITGDLIFRGPKSIKILTFLYSIKKNIKIVLGNNDISFLKYNYFHKNKTLNNLFNEKFLNFLNTKKAKKILNWIKKQKLVRICTKKKIIMVHAGIPIEWNMKTILKECKRTQKVIKNIQKYPLIFNKIYENNKINRWSKKMSSINKISFTLNSFTRMRYYSNDKTLMLNYNFKNSPNNIKYKNIIPWYKLKNKNIPKDYHIIFGHWASIRNEKLPEKIICIDKGCCWGGHLSLIKWNNKKIYKQKSLIKNIISY